MVFDTEFRKMLSTNPFSESIRFCYQCGICTGGCPSTKHTALRTREIILRASLGLKSVLDCPELWLCLMCHRCLANCKAGVDITNVIAVLRNYVAQTDEQKVPPNFIQSIKLFCNTGLGFPVTKHTERLRNELELPSVKLSTDVLNEIRTLIKHVSPENKWLK